MGALHMTVEHRQLSR